MSYQHGPTPWPPRSAPPPPPSQPHPSTSDAHPHHGNLFLMVGELMGGMRWLISDAHRKTEQIDDIQAKLRDGSHLFKRHDERLTHLEEADKVSRIERLTKRWAAFLLPPATVLVTWWLTGSLDAGFKILERMPK
jgi:hypothetical protein